MKFLIVAPSWVGDTLIAQPLLTRLKQQHPDARIDVLAPDWSAPLLGRMSEVDEVIGNPLGHGQFGFSARRSLGRTLAKRRYDRAYVLPNSWKSALTPWFANIPVRIGYHGEARFGLLTDRRKLDARRHPQLVQRFAALAEPPAHALPAELPRPHLVSTPTQQHAVRLALDLPTGIAPIVFCPGAEYGPAKRWPARHFADLARRIASKENPVWVVGSAKDQAIGAEIADLSHGQATNLCGRTSLEQVIDLIASARFVICNDSGLMHVAAALDRPLTAIYGSSSPAFTPPLSPHATILSLQLSCSPCFKRTCPLGHLNCLNGLDPDTVLSNLPV